MTKSQIIRELTIELAAKCKLARGLDRDLIAALQRQLELETELRRTQEDNKTLEQLVDDYTLRYENERAARERVLEHVKALETEIERMREDTMTLLIGEYGPMCTLDRFKKALGIIK